ncbi:PAS domain-containing protein [Autumnicola musiva]|uniref:histidine kinase n=1 Tax=Autumnicola musiva TaxID=3075589 RepID=A0ABU3D6M3_9FLAO|nr:PAS domain-containing protein [Zunongwangia sp. F117]MDT0676668.1 PAS domain-containing protein [Zunongwangia sp. F117]
MKQKLRNVFELFPVASVILDFRDDSVFINLFNKKFSSLFSLDKTQATGKNLFSKDLADKLPCFQQNRDLIFNSCHQTINSESSTKISCPANVRNSKGILTSHYYQIEIQAISDTSAILLTIEDVTRNMQEKNKEAKAQNYLHNLVKNIPGVTYRCKVDKQWTMKFLNDKVEDLTGYPASDFLENRRRTYASIIHPDDIQSTYKALNEIKEKNFFTLNYRIQNAKGKLVWVEEQGTGVYSTNGELLYFDGVIMDVTEKVNQQKKLEEHNKRFEALVQEASDLISVLDEEANFIFSSESAGRILGIPTSELIGKNAFDFLHPEDKSRLFTEFEKLKKTKQIHPLPYRFRDAQGNWRWFKTIATNLSEDPAVKGIVVNSRDITTEYLQKEELEKTNERYRLAKKATNDALWDLDLLKNKIYWGEGYNKIFGYKENTFCFNLTDAHNLSKIYTKDTYAVFESLMTTINDKNSQVWKEKYRYMRADGSVASVSNRAFIIRDKNGRALRLVGALQDITEEQNRQEQSSLLTGIKADLQDCETLDNGFSQMMQRLCTYNGAGFAELWLTSRHKDEIHKSAQIIPKEFCGAVFKKLEDLEILQMNDGIYGKKIEEELLFWKKEELDQILQKNHGFSAACGVPLFSSGEVVGVICFFSRSEDTYSQRHMEVLKAISNEIAFTISHKKKEEELFNFFNLSREILCIASLKGDILRINPAVEDILGYTAEDAMQKTFLDFLHPEDLQKVKQEIATLKEGGNHLNFEARYLRKDGKAVWISWTTSTLQEEKLVYAVGKDITHSKHAALKLREKTEKFEYAQKIGRMGHWKRELDQDKDISEWSKAAYKIFERSPVDFIPTMENLRNAFHPEDRHLLDGELPFDKFKKFEHRILTSKGAVKWVLQRIKLVTDGNGVPLRLEGIIQDITEEKEKELQVKISNERYKKALKATQEMIWDWDLSTNKVIRNKSFYKIFGYKNSSVTSSQEFWFKNIHPEDRSKVVDSITKTSKSKTKKKWSMHYRFYKANGEIAYVSDKAYIVRDNDKKAVRLVGAARDVTRSKLMIDEIQQQNKLLKEITWIQSHEVRAPLSRILSLVNLLPEIDSKEEREEFLKYLEISAKDLDAIIKQVIAKAEFLI